MTHLLSAQAWHPETFGFGLLFFGLGAMQIGVIVGQIRGKGLPIFRSKPARFFFSEEYRPRFLRGATWFERTLGLVVGTAFTVAGIFLIVVSTFDALAS